MWENLHHAYLLSGRDDVLTFVRDFLEKTAGVVPQDTPDLLYIHLDRFAIDDVRTLIGRAALKPVALPRRIVVVQCTDITREAQQALLKTLEEPSPHTTFFFSVAAPHALLPTVRSRFASCDEVHPRALSEEARQFAGATYREREQYLKEVLATRTERDTHTLAQVQSLLHGLEHLAAATLSRADVREGMHALYYAKRALLTPSVALKPALEHLAILFPRLNT